MAVRKFSPATPGQRHKVIGTFEEITASVPEKSLVYGKRSTGGRNNTGKMTMRYIGGGHKKKYRLIDFKREKDGVPAVVKTIEYDPNRSARIALLFYADGEKRYIIAPNGLKVGDKLMSGAEAAPEIGVRARVLCSFVRLVTLLSLLLVKVPIASSSFLLERPVRCSQPARQQWAALATPTTHWSSRVRQAAHAGLAVVLTTVVLL